MGDSKAYYNENDKFAAAWLRELIREGLIADGEVDERSIVDVRPEDLVGFAQCHFFAGIGGWSYALRLAGWPDDRPVWTGSCPCQPFSSARKGDGAADPRHLWPTWFGLIRERRPPVVFGEQVASIDGLAWLDLVSADVEGAGYAIGACDLCAAGIGAPHIRQRLYFVANANGWQSRNRAIQRGWEYGQRKEDGLAGPLEYTEYDRAERSSGSEGRQERAPSSDGQDEGSGLVQARDAGASNAVGNADSERRPQRDRFAGDDASTVRTSAGQATLEASPWSDVEWVWCRDGKARPVKPGILPLAHGVPNRLGTLRGAGNAIVPEVAACFVMAFDELAQAVPAVATQRESA